MARAGTGKMTRGKKGFFRTIGHYILDGRRTPRKFWLGHDRALANRKVVALETAWQSLPGERGEKVWTEDAIRAALEPLTAGVALLPIAASLAPVAPVAIPVFPSETVCPPPLSRTYTLPQTDSIRLTWERCLNTAPTGTRELPFGAVKKCEAQIIENLGGHELAQLFLAHRPATVAAGHYTGASVSVGIGKTPFQRLHDVQKQMYEVLRPLLFERRARRGTPEDDCQAA